MENLDKLKWKIRRRIVNITLLFCASTIVYLVTKDADTELNRAIANGIILLAGSTIGSYIFGSTWDDKGN